MIKYKTEWPNHTLYHYIIFDIDKVVGSCNVEINGGYTKLQSLFIQEKYRNRGYATQIIKEIINDFDDDIWLSVYLDNNKAISLYESLGFVFDDEEYEDDDTGWMILKNKKRI